MKSEFIGMSKTECETRLREIGEELFALPIRLPLNSGKVFTYTVNRRREGDFLKIVQVPREGEQCDFQDMAITLDGKWLHFSFFSFSGESEEDAERAREYARDCAELLSGEFTYTLSADYGFKAAKFKSLKDEYAEVSKRLIFQ
jgi:hypothetical protein